MRIECQLMMISTRHMALHASRLTSMCAHCIALLTASSHTETSAEARIDAVALHVQHTLLPSLSRSSAWSTSTRADVGITGLVIDDMTSNDRSIACMLQLLDATSSSSRASIMMRVVSDGARRRRQSNCKQVHLHLCDLSVVIIVHVRSRNIGNTCVTCCCVVCVSIWCVCIVSL